jgi:hypothetical protein
VEVDPSLLPLPDSLMTTLAQCLSLTSPSPLATRIRTIVLRAFNYFLKSPKALAKLCDLSTSREVLPLLVSTSLLTKKTPGHSLQHVERKLQKGVQWLTDLTELTGTFKSASDVVISLKKEYAECLPHSTLRYLPETENSIFIPCRLEEVGNGSIELKEKDISDSDSARPLPLQYFACTGDDDAVIISRGDVPIPEALPFFYFEAKVEKIVENDDSTVGIGLHPTDFELEGMPGWSTGTYGFHSDDGEVGFSSLLPLIHLNC